MTSMRSFAAWRTSLRNFDWLVEAVSGAMDLDCLIERNGYFMVLEGKPWSESASMPGVVMPYGQHKALYKLSKQPQTRVYLIGETSSDRIHVAHYADSPPPEYVRKGNISWWKPERFVPTTKDEFVHLVQAWWRDASEGVLE
jgi:hypothetical protein